MGDTKEGLNLLDAFESMLDEWARCRCCSLSSGGRSELSFKKTTVREKTWKRPGKMQHVPGEQSPGWKPEFRGQSNHVHGVARGASAASNDLNVHPQKDDSPHRVHCSHCHQALREGVPSENPSGLQEHNSPVAASSHMQAIKTMASYRYEPPGEQHAYRSNNQELVGRQAMSEQYSFEKEMYSSSSAHTVRSTHAQEFFRDDEEDMSREACQNRPPKCEHGKKEDSSKLPPSAARPLHGVSPEDADRSSHTQPHDDSCILRYETHRASSPSSSVQEHTLCSPPPRMSLSPSKLNHSPSKQSAHFHQQIIDNSSSSAQFRNTPSPGTLHAAQRQPHSTKHVSEYVSQQVFPSTVEGHPYAPEHISSRIISYSAQEQYKTLHYSVLQADSFSANGPQYSAGFASSQGPGCDASEGESSRSAAASGLAFTVRTGSVPFSPLGYLKHLYALPSHTESSPSNAQRDANKDTTSSPSKNPAARIDRNSLPSYTTSQKLGTSSHPSFPQTTAYTTSVPFSAHTFDSPSSFSTRAHSSLTPKIQSPQHDEQKYIQTAQASIHTRPSDLPGESQILRHAPPRRTAFTYADTDCIGQPSLGLQASSTISTQAETKDLLRPYLGSETKATVTSEAEMQDPARKLHVPKTGDDSIQTHTRDLTTPHTTGSDVNIPVHSRTHLNTRASF